VPAGTSKSTSRRHGIQAVTKFMAYVANAVTLVMGHIYVEPETVYFVFSVKTLLKHP
jgi:hypothetical protein